MPSLGSAFGASTTPTAAGMQSSLTSAAAPLIPYGGGTTTAAQSMLAPVIGPGSPALATPFDWAGALSTGLEKLNDVAQPAANISQAVSPFMSEEQPIQASPIAPPTYSNNLNELVAQNEQTDQQRMQEEMMRRMEQRQRIQAMGEMA